jgi:arabinofuranosyltransferase
VLERWAVRAAVLVLLAGTLVHALYGYSHEDLSGHAIGSDDAYISYRYARNLAAGLGLTFNPGERVEGYSNLLYVLLLAPAFLIARDSAIHPIAVALNGVCAVAALVLFQRRLLDRDGHGPAALAAVLFAAWPALWLWNASGMETALVLLLQIALWAEVTRDDGAQRIRPLVVVLALLVLARADGVVGAGIGVLFLALRRDGARARAGALAVALSTAALVGWRLAYYGHPLPNTYYAKVSGPLTVRIGDAARQLGDLALDAGLLPYLVVLAAAAVASARARRLSFEPLFAAAWIAYWIYVGGDVFGERFLLVLVPLGAAVLARWAAEGRRVLATAGFIAALAFQLAPLAADRRFRYAGAKYDRWIALGRFLGRPEHRGKTIAVDAAGKIPYYSHLAAIDMLGLTDAHIGHGPAATFSVGHSKHDAEYVLARRPDLVATWIDEGLDLRWELGRARYEPAGYRLRWLVYVRRFPPADRDAIVDVRGMDPSVVPDLVHDGWQYAVVERIVP